MLVGIHGDDQISTHNAAALLSVQEGRTADGLVELDALVRLVGVETPDATLLECLRTARRAQAHDHELHFALCRYFAAPGARGPNRAVKEAALGHPSLAREGYRIHRRRARVRDWISIADTDPFGEWPQMAAFAAAGANHPVSLDEVLPVGATSAGPVRVTRLGRSVAVGVLTPPDLTSGVPLIVPSLSVWDCSAAFAWSGPADSEVRGSVAVLATPYKFSGYWHWIHEGLLPLLTLQRSGVLATLDRVLVCVDDAVPAHVTDSLRAAGLAEANIEVTVAPFDLVAERLLPAVPPAMGGMIDNEPSPRITVGPANRWPGYPAALAHLRSCMDVPSTPGARRIYVSRHDATKRRVANEDALVGALAERGFERLLLGPLPFEDQVAHFRNAEVVVGPHGAGLTNLAFTAAGAAVVELRPSTGLRDHFERLAADIGARYASVVCPPDPTAPEDVVADVDEVVSVLDALLAH